MAKKPEDNTPSLQETHGTQNETSSAQMQDTVLIRMLTILQNIEENQQKAKQNQESSSTQRLDTVLCKMITILQNIEENQQKAKQDQEMSSAQMKAILQNIEENQQKDKRDRVEMMEASHKTEKNKERWRKGSSESGPGADSDETTLIPPVVQDNMVSTTGHILSGNTVMVGRRNKNIVNNNVRCNMILCVLKNSDQSSNDDQSHSVENELRNAICNPNNPLVQELEQRLEAKLDDVRAGSIILVFLTANRNHFRKLFYRHEPQIKCRLENYIIELFGGTKASYSIDIKIEDDHQDIGKDKSSKGISFTKKDNNLHNEEMQSGGDDDNDDDDDGDDDNSGAASANPYISGSLDEKRHESDIRPEIMGKSKFSSTRCNRTVGGSLRRNNIDRIDECSSSGDSLIDDNNGINIKKKGVLKNKNRLPLKMGSNAHSLEMTRLQSHGEKSKNQEKFGDDDDSDDNKQDNLDGEQRRIVSTFPDVSQEHRMHDSHDDLQNYKNNLDDKDNKDGKDYQEMSIRRQFGPVETELDSIYRRDKVMPEEDILHSDRNHQRRKASKGNKSDDNTKYSGMCAKGKDSRGVQRGACKGCNECIEFKGDARCDYCNCAATQHINLIHGSSTLHTTASASKMGNVQDSKRKDGRGIERGKCSGCTECSEFRGDVRCDYCNCSATQHVNLTNLPTGKNTPSTFSREASENARGKDRQGIWRGNCNVCTECLEFTGDARCDYCNCAATQHVNLTQLPSKKVNPSPFSKGALNNAKGKDGRGVKRGKCSGCTECSEFSGDMRCDYCNCAATQHFNYTTPSSSIDTSRHLPRTSQPGIDSRGIQRERCTHCNDCNFFSGADRCDYCNCAATQHIKLTSHRSLTDPSTNTDISIDLSDYTFMNKVYAYEKSSINNWTQDHTLRIRVRPHSEQPDEISQTELQQRFQGSIQNKKMQIKRDVQNVFGAVFKDIRFENGCILINMLIFGLERDAEIMLRERRERIENYAKSLVEDIFPVQLMNLNWHRNQTLEIDMGGIFTSVITDSWQQSSNHER